MLAGAVRLYEDDVLPALLNFAAEHDLPRFEEAGREHLAWMQDQIRSRRSAKVDGDPRIPRLLRELMDIGTGRKRAEDASRELDEHMWRHVFPDIAEPGEG